MRLSRCRILASLDYLVYGTCLYTSSTSILFLTNAVAKAFVILILLFLLTLNSWCLMFVCCWSLVFFFFFSFLSFHCEFIILRFYLWEFSAIRVEGGFPKRGIAFASPRWMESSPTLRIPENSTVNLRCFGAQVISATHLIKPGSEFLEVQESPLFT